MVRRHTRRLQINAFHHHVSHVKSNKRSLPVAFSRPNASNLDDSDVSKSDASSRLMDYPLGQGGRLRLPDPLSVGTRSVRDVVHNKADEKRLMRRMRLKKKVKVPKKKTKETIEKARDESFSADLMRPIELPKQNWVDKCIDGVSDLIYNDPEHFQGAAHKPNDRDGALVFDQKIEDYKNTRFKYFLARRTIDTQPKLLADELAATDIGVLGNDTKKHKKKKSVGTPGAYSLHAESFIHNQELSAQKRHSFAPLFNSAMPVTTNATYLPAKTAFSFDKKDVENIMKMCRENDLLTEQLLYDIRYDEKWKPRYAKEQPLDENGKKMKKFGNRAGWVIPLRRICMKVGFNSSFFTDNRRVNLDEARAFVLYHRLTALQEVSEWVSRADEKNVRNENVEVFFNDIIEGHNVQKRMKYFNKRIENDLDRLRIQGLYYNNIYLGKRMFGPGRKQMFIRTVVGGMERRFEILDNQVNHIVFSHNASDHNQDKCRNSRVKCRDNTRVILRYPFDSDDDFIHANFVRGGPLFNTFIITQAPMENTIGDFWRMIWQEKVPYIFMLISRKDSKRCANYWPRKKGTSMSYFGLVIQNEGVDDFRLPNFRVTSLLIKGPQEQELHVEHWQGDMNNSDNVVTPLQLLRLARNSSFPTVVHCHLGISRSAALIAAELTITSLLKGPSYRNTVQKAVQYLRSQRAFSIETPMQFIYIHRIVQQFIRPLVGDAKGFHSDYKRWMNERSQRPFIDDIKQPLASYRQLSPPIDPDLIALARHRERPEYRRETHDLVGKLPIPFEDACASQAGELLLPKKYPRGNRYP